MLSGEKYAVFGKEKIMKNMKNLMTLFIIGLLLSPTLILAQGDGMKLSEKTIKFDKPKYENEIKKLFEGNAMGYQVILLKNGKIVSEIAGGKARNAFDGEAKMTVNTPANIGSTAKFFGGTALLHEFQKTSKIGGGMDSWLSEKIYNYFPVVWKQNMHTSINQISFKDLLQHRSGFIQSDSEAKVYFDYLSKGVSSDTSQKFYYGKRNYANANITSVGYLLPLIDNAEELKNLNVLIGKKSLKPDDISIQTYMGDLFEIYMKGKVFNTIKPAISPSCDPTNDYPAKNIVYAKTYTAANDVFKGSVYSSKIDNPTKACHAAGGWYVSGRELAAYVANFSATETIVSKETREKMFDDKKTDNRLLWSSAAGDEFFKEKLNWSSTPYMGGDQGGAHGTIIMLPDGYYAVGIVNSDISPANKVGQNGGSGMLTRNIMESFKAGIAANF